VQPFAQHIISWQRRHGRHNLPWQGADAYRIWLSEIMLQQTQVATVIPYYQRFVSSFPEVASLAAASEDDVLAHWSGLGYYARARNLHRAAQFILQRHDGKFPRDFDDIAALPGIGRSTAAAISALAFHERRAILDGNVKRVLARYCAIEGYPGDKKIEAQLWRQAESFLPQRDVAIYIQGLMDLGATICTRGKPRCDTCPVQKGCAAYMSDRVAQLPSPRPRKVLPEKHDTFLVLMYGSDILLEKRPGNGIWGGLWCLPQVASGDDVSAYCTRRFGVDATRAEALPEFIHTFTHFKLHIAPLLVRLAHKPRQIQKPGVVWLDAENALRAAIPAPVRKLVEQITPDWR
jgi:A/G-specific adenine glycosylase